MASLMSLRRRIRHRASRRQFIGEAFFCYLLVFVVIFLRLHFGKHYSLFSPEEHLSVNAAARESMLWAFIGPVLWILHEYVLRGTDLWDSFSDWTGRCSGLL